MTCPILKIGQLACEFSVVDGVGGIAEGESAANGTVAHEAELEAVVAGLQDGGLVTAVVVAVDVVAGTKLLRCPLVSRRS